MSPLYLQGQKVKSTVNNSSHHEFGSSIGPWSDYITVISGQAKSPARTPITSPVLSDRLIKSPSKSPFGSPLGQNRPIKTSIKSPTISITQDEIFTGQNCVTVTEEETETLALVPVLDDPTTGSGGKESNGGFGDISGEIIIPPDANDNTNIEEDLFRFKKPALEFLENEEKPKKAKRKRKQPDQESVSTKSSRKIAIEKRKKADFNIEKNTAGKKT